ncbi:11823_t:CDS:2 [Cetraspora pellucida]|uniref:11823_t:CDS:1 n=1 Tax=Cetraspora pellucida TaxID=1433469 RepID=A0ACA9L120_9GLOM|nr:11823_t:CDS:2 [Cetraspora pellucida]
MAPFMWVLFCIITILVWELLKVIAKFLVRHSSESKDNVGTFENIDARFVCFSEFPKVSEVSDEITTSVLADSSKTPITSTPERQSLIRPSSYPFPPGINPWGRGRPKVQFRRPKKPLRVLSPAEQVARELRVPVEVIEIIPSNNPFTVYRLKKSKSCGSNIQSTLP